MNEQRGIFLLCYSFFNLSQFQVWIIIKKKVIAKKKFLESLVIISKI